MKLLYVYKEPDENSVIKTTNWIAYNGHMYLKLTFFLQSPKPASTLDNWIKVGELIQIEKPI